MLITLHFKVEQNQGYKRWQQVVLLLPTRIKIWLPIAVMVVVYCLEIDCTIFLGPVVNLETEFSYNTCEINSVSCAVTL